MYHYEHIIGVNKTGGGVVRRKLKEGDSTMGGRKMWGSGEASKVYLLGIEKKILKSPDFCSFNFNFNLIDKL